MFRRLRCLLGWHTWTLHKRVVEHCDNRGCVDRVYEYCACGATHNYLESRLVK